MDLYLTVDADKVKNTNGQKNTVYITVDLRSLWTEICSRYTNIHVEVQVCIPVIDGKSIVIEMAEDFEVLKIQNYKVEFVAVYFQKEETVSQPFGNAEIWGYRLLGGSGT